MNYTTELNDYVKITFSIPMNYTKFLYPILTD